jgi:hypothetical protein
VLKNEWLEYFPAVAPCRALAYQSRHTNGLRIKQQDRQYTHHVTMWHVRQIIGIMGKQQWLNFVFLT